MPNDSKKINVVLPTFNGKKYIRQAIDSLLGQTHKNLEFIVVDDGSFDGTSDIIKSYASEKIKLLKHERNQGLSHALNAGFEAANGEYFSWASDDNFYDRQAFEILAKELDSNPKIDFVYSNFYQVDESGSIIRRFNTCGPKKLLMKNCVGPCFLYRRKVYEQTGDYDASFKLAEDYEYWLRASLNFKFKKINDYLCYYRLHSESLRFQNKACVIEEQASRACERFAKPAIRLYHKGKVLFQKEDYIGAIPLLAKSAALSPLNLEIWKLFVFVLVCIFSPKLAKKIRNL